MSTDGLFFVIKDAQKEVREMTAEEQERFKACDFETKMFDGKPILGEDGKPIRTRLQPKERQMKITVVSKKAEADVEMAEDKGVQITVVEKKPDAEAETESQVKPENK